MADLSKWLKNNTNARARLYKKYGKPLEAGHTGEFIAIGYDGRTVLGADDGQVLRQAIQDLGSGNFVLARVGQPTYGKRLKLSK